MKYDNAVVQVFHFSESKEKDEQDNQEGSKADTAAQNGQQQHNAPSSSKKIS